MIDLYALHSDFPGLDEANALRFDPYKRVTALEEKWREVTGDDRFQFPTYERLKTSVAPQMAEDIGLPTIRSQCRHFDAWLGRLERLGGG